MSDFDYANATVPEILRHQSKQQAEGVARDMEQTAARIRQVASRFDQDPAEHPGYQAASIVAEIVQEHANLGGATGSRLWGLVRELGRMPDTPKS